MCLLFLVYAGILTGILAIVLGLRAMARKVIRLTYRRTLTGTTAFYFGLSCALGGLAFILYIIALCQVYPEGLGH